MTGYESKKNMAQDKLDNDDLTIAYQSGYYDGKKAAQPAQDEDAIIIQYHEATIKRLEKRIEELMAQPAQGPVAWHTMEAKYPTLDLDIRMGDGSILCNVWPQNNGDLWWEGSGTGEKFIDPKYANVTHWRIHSDTAPPQPAQEPVANDRALKLVTHLSEQWKAYALELQERLVKYEGGSPMILNKEKNT